MKSIFKKCENPCQSVLIPKLASLLPWPAHPLVFRVPNPHLRQVDFTCAICMGGPGYDSHRWPSS